MPEEVAAVAEPGQETVLKDFGDLDAVFDKVFPTTAEKKEGDDDAAPPQPPKPPPPQQSQPQPSEAAPPETTTAEPPQTEPAPSTSSDDLPDFLTGKKEEPKPAPPPEPEIPAESPKDSKGMRQLREAYNNLKRASAEKEQQFTTQIEELKKRPETVPDSDKLIEEQKKQIAQLTETLEQVGFQYSEKFQKEYVQPLTQLHKEGQEMLMEAGLDPAQWDKAMALSGRARIDALQELYDQLPKAVADDLGRTSTDIKRLLARRDAELADKAGLRQKLQQEQLAHQREAVKEHEKRTLDNLAETGKYLVEQMGIEVYRKSADPKHAKWNESVDQMEADAKRLLMETTDERVMAIAARLAPAALRYRQLWQMERDRRIEAEKQNKAVEAAEPKLESRGTAEPGESEADKKLSFAQAVAKGVFG